MYKRLGEKMTMLDLKCITLKFKFAKWFSRLIGLTWQIMLREVEMLYSEKENIVT